MSDDRDVPRPPSVRRLTRRTARFAELAEATDRILAQRGVDVPAHLVDDVLNERNATVAALLGVEARQALVHAPDSVSQDMADNIAAALAQRPGGD